MGVFLGEQILKECVFQVKDVIINVYLLGIHFIHIHG